MGLYHSEAGHSALIVLFLLFLVLGAAVVSAQTLEPRAYSNIPISQTFLLLGYIHSDGDITPAPVAPVQDIDLTIDAVILGGAHSFSIAGKSSKVDFVGSRSCYEGTGIFQGEAQEHRRCEYGDPTVKLTWNFYGAPALTLEEYRKWDPGLVIGSSLEASIPIGTYNSENIINAGANRWVIRPGLGLSYHWEKWFFDFSGSIRFFEDNDNFFNGLVVEQDPLYQIQSHLIYIFPKGRWLSLDLNYYWGGESTKGDIEPDDRMENSRVGLTFLTPLTIHHSLKFFAASGVRGRVGGNFDNLGLIWQYRF